MSYETELAKLREIAARRDFSLQGDAEYAAQVEVAKRALFAQVNAEIQADLARGKSKPKKAKGWK